MRALLTYHSVDASGSVISVDRDTFRRHVAWLADGPVRVGTIPDTLHAPAGEDWAALTFDDGFVNFASEAWPVLRGHGLTATIFIVTDRAGGANDWEDLPGTSAARLPLLDWDALGRLAEEGVEIGSHTRTHPRLDRLEPARVEDELAQSRETIHTKIGRQPRVVAYPYGAVTRTIARLAGTYYTYGCTTDLRSLGRSETPTLLPRLDAFYFRAAGSLMRWGTARQRIRLWTRRQARRLRHRWRR